MKKILIKGKGIGGLTVAFELSKRGHQVTISAPINAFEKSASWYAGGMLAPFCERENNAQIIEDLGLAALDWWIENFPSLVKRNGTLVVAPPRDIAELRRFAAKTKSHEEIDAKKITALEPDLAGRFQSGLFFSKEAHIDPRKALLALRDELLIQGATFVDVGETESCYDIIIDATGISRLGEDPDLRGIRGEMLILRCRDVHFSRPIRLLHPRIPLYIVPRDEDLFMLGATMIESDFRGGISARSMMELLNAAYTLQPAFSEAEIVEAGTGIRPAYPDNIPRVTQNGKYIFINGFFRHGYLLSPEMAKKTVCIVEGK